MVYSASKNDNKHKFYEALSLISKIENKIMLEDYMIEECGIVFKKASYKEGMPVLMCNCPIHNETTPSFALYTYNQTFFCFSCKKSGGLVNFVQHLNKWSWLQTINFFANKLNLNHNITEEDILDSLSNKIEKYQKEINKYNDFDINFKVSDTCREIKKKYGYIKEIKNYIEKIFLLTDIAILKKDKASLYKIKEEALPLLIDKVHNYEIKEKKFIENNLEHLGCNKCALIHQTDKITLGEGKVTAKVIFIVENPKNNNEYLKNIIIDMGFDINDIYIDYVYNCTPKDNGFYFNEGMTCINKWLIKTINIINPKSIMILGENAARIFLNNKNIQLQTYINSELTIKDIKVNFNYSIDEKEFHEEFKKNINRYLNNYL